MDEETLRRREAEAALGLAREYLKSAENASLHSFYRLAVDGAYNSAELCVKGLLLSKLTEMPKSHGGAVQMFGREYVMPGLAPAELGHRLNLHLQLRNKARYDFHARITKDDAQASLDMVRDFVDLLEKQLHGEREQSLFSMTLCRCGEFSRCFVILGDTQQAIRCAAFIKPRES